MERRKFLKTANTEFAHLSEQFTRIALAHERIHFTLRHGERLLHDLPGTNDWRERIAAFFGDAGFDPAGAQCVHYVGGPCQQRHDVVIHR